MSCASGALYVIGLGPGDDALLTGEARAALDACTDLFGYSAYVDRVPPRAGQVRHGSDNREELARARAALALAASGGRVGIVSGGDPGVFAMASAVFEAIEAGEPVWRNLEVTVVPGVSAMFAAAARLGAPLGHDFAVVSLSDNLKPWPLILRRLVAFQLREDARNVRPPVFRKQIDTPPAAIIGTADIRPGFIDIATAAEAVAAG